jgi:hypothetical protein
MHRLYFCTGFLRIHFVPRFLIGSKAHLANTGAAPMETPILTGNRACSLGDLLSRLMELTDLDYHIGSNCISNPLPCLYR